MNRERANAIQQVESVTIASGASASGEINQTQGSLVGIHFPSTFDGTTVTFTGSDASGGTFTPVIGSDGNAISFTVAASKFLALTDAQARQLAAVPYLKIVAGTNQTTTDTILKVTKRVIH